jgi:hypothetical protein
MRSHTGAHTAQVADAFPSSSAAAEADGTGSADDGACAVAADAERDCAPLSGMPSS